MNDKPETKIGYVSPLKRICMTIGELPTSYLETMSYYEMLIWFTKFLQEKVIPTIDNNAQAVEELQHLFIELQSYVNNYFDNLDVQEEINNKLDQMLEDGVLEQIIEQFLQLTSLICFDNVQSMKESPNLTNGSFAKTLGYYNKNDGGGATYKIRTITNDDVVDNMFIIEMNNDDNSLIAELIIENNTININQLGAKGDNETDDYEILKAAIDSDYNIILNNQIYLTSHSLELTKRKNITGNGIIKASTQMTYVLYIHFEYDQKFNKFEFGIDCNNLENTIGLCISGCSRNEFVISIYNCDYIGIYPRYDNLSMSSNRWNISGYNTSNNNAILLNGGQDEIFESIYSKDFKTTVKILRGGNTYQTIHGWTSSSLIYSNSKLIDIGAASVYENTINNMIWDTIETCIDCNNNNTGMSVNNLIYEFNTNLVPLSTSNIIDNAGSICKINFNNMDYNMQLKLINGNVTISPKELYNSTNSDARYLTAFNDSSKSITDFIKITSSNFARILNVSNSDWVESSFDSNYNWVLTKFNSENGINVNIYKYANNWKLLKKWIIPYNGNGVRQGSAALIFVNNETGSIEGNSSATFKAESNKLYQIFIHRAGNINPAMYLVQNSNITIISDTDTACTITYDSSTTTFTLSNNKSFGINYVIKEII